MPRNLKKERAYVTKSMNEAFRAAMMIGLEWKSMEGPAVVMDVAQHGTGWCITYRLIKHWGKEAWSRS